MSIISTAAYVTTASLGTAAAAESHPTPPWQMVLTVAAILGALGVIWRALHLGEAVRDLRSLARLSQLQQTFLIDWNGEPERPGVAARPGYPERFSVLERHMHEVKGAMPTIAVGLEELHHRSAENGAKIDRLDDKHVATDARISDHARRNEEAAKVLRAELERRAGELERQLHDRNDVVDQRFETLSQDLLRAEAYRAALVELGLPIDPKR